MLGKTRRTRRGPAGHSGRAINFLSRRDNGIFPGTAGKERLTALPAFLCSLSPVWFARRVSVQGPLETVRLGRKGTGTFFGLHAFTRRKAETGRKMSQSPAACERLPRRPTKKAADHSAASVVLVGQGAGAVCIAPERLGTQFGRSVFPIACESGTLRRIKRQIAHRDSKVRKRPPVDCDEWSRCKKGEDLACYCTCRG